MKRYQPAFLGLPKVPGNPDLRWVGSRMMDSEQYHVEGWRVVDEYDTDTSRRPDQLTPPEQRHIRVWQPDPGGLRAYSELLTRRKQERIAAALSRRQEDHVSWHGAIADAETSLGFPVDER